MVLSFPTPSTSFQNTFRILYRKDLHPCVFLCGGGCKPPNFLGLNVFVGGGRPGVVVVLDGSLVWVGGPVNGGHFQTQSAFVGGFGIVRQSVFMWGGVEFFNCFCICLFIMVFFSFTWFLSLFVIINIFF